MSVNKVNNDGSLSRVAGGTLYADLPIGVIIPFGGSVIPSGYLLCNGAEVLKTAYAELYAVIGDAFGTASVNTKFVLPDLREAVPKGAGLSGKSSVHYDSDGVALGEFVEDRIQDHRHEVSVIPQSGGSQYIAGCSGGAISKSLTDYVDTTITTSTRTGATTEVKSIGINYFMKVKQVAIPTDFLDAVDDIIKDTTVDAVTNGDMNPITSNAVYDEFKKVQPQTYECSGFLVNALAGEITGYGRATVILRDGIAEIKFSVRIHTNDGPATFNWGLNRDLLHTLLPNLPVITPIGNNSNLQFFAGTGDVLIDLMGYGAMASSSNQFWVPARMYQIDGSTGTWGTDRFPINSYITGTVYGIYTV